MLPHPISPEKQNFSHGPEISREENVVTLTHLNFTYVNDRVQVQKWNFQVYDQLYGLFQTIPTSLATHTRTQNKLLHKNTGLR